ncbi:hypothetical protein UlMin_001850 [Ulmus minor]
MLPSYCYMLEMANLGTVTRIEVDGESRFRKVIGIDETFLKGPYKGVLLVATAQDGNSKCYPITWVIVDSENDDSWTWFLTRMKEVIGDTDELVFVSDRAKSIKNFVSTVFNNAQHSAYAWHVAHNVKNKFKCSDIMGSYWKAVNAYRVEEFNGYMTEISRRYPRVSEYLENEVGFEKWSTCHFPGLRYNITTTNMVESLNSMLVNAREFPYITLLDVIQAKMSKWWNKRWEIGVGLTSPLTPKREDELRGRFAVANGLLTTQLNNVTFHVRGGALDGVVDTQNSTCSCREFDIDRLPCVHAIAAA